MDIMDIMRSTDQLECTSTLVSPKAFTPNYSMSWQEKPRSQGLKYAPIGPENASITSSCAPGMVLVQYSIHHMIVYSKLLLPVCKNK